MNDLYVYHRGKKLKCGYTTGSCAAAAAKAAAYMLYKQTILKTVTISTPAGVELTMEVIKPSYDAENARCCVIKDGGDDHDATHGIEIFAHVTKRNDNMIKIRGGKGIGAITKPGFWGNPGERAINPVPRRMIEQEVRSVSDQGWNVVISAPEGEKIAEKTMNERLGIVNGISIIGTTGIVEPMSNEAIKQSIYLEIDTVLQKNTKSILLFLGNYGRGIAIDLNLSEPSVKISNFIGDAVLYCKNRGVNKVTLIGHIGKLSKLSIGAFNTHNAVCDGRIEAFVYYLALAGAPTSVITTVSESTDSEEALQKVIKNGYSHIMSNMRQGCIDRLKKYVKSQTFNIEVIMYSMEKGVL